MKTRAQVLAKVDPRLWGLEHAQDASKRVQEAFKPIHTPVWVFGRDAFLRALDNTGIWQVHLSDRTARHERFNVLGETTDSG